MQRAATTQNMMCDDQIARTTSKTCESFLDEEVLQNKIIRFLGKNYN